MDRKAQVESKLALTVIVAIGIAVGIVLLAFIFGLAAIFSEHFIFYILGITILILSLIFGLPQVVNGKISKFGGWAMFAFISIGLLLILLPAFGLIENASLGGDQYIQIPLTGFYSCEPASAPVDSAAKSIVSGYNKIACPDNTDSCDLIVKSTESVSLLSVRQLIVVRNGNAEFKTFTILNGVPQTTISGVTKNDQISVRYVNPLTAKDASGGQYYARYKPFILWKTSPTGGKTEYSSVQQGCSFTAKDANKIIVSESLGIGTGTSSTVETVQPYKTRNFIDVIIPASVENSRIQGNQYCSNNKLYAIDNITTVSTTYRIVNTNEVVGSVECCTGDVEPGIRQCVNNKWKALPKPGTTPSANEAIQCSAFKPCAGSEYVPFTSGQLVRSVCENNICLQKTKDVECTVDSACKNPLKPVCDTKTYTCTDIPTAKGPGDIVPKTEDEAKALCEQKANEHPWLGYTFIKKDTTECGIICGLTGGLIGETKSTETSCKAANVPYFIVGGVILILGIVGIVSLTSKKRKS